MERERKRGISITSAELQFEVSADRMQHEVGARIVLDTLPYYLARNLGEARTSEISGMHGVEIARRHDATS